tara:strand:- start:835 stop:1098 length:264 start_codon:yes stop_codon:yes gene_type:complete
MWRAIAEQVLLFVSMAISGWSYFRLHRGALSRSEQLKAQCWESAFSEPFSNGVSITLQCYWNRFAMLTKVACSLFPPPSELKEQMNV